MAVHGILGEPNQRSLGQRQTAKVLLRPDTGNTKRSKCGPSGRCPLGWKSAGPFGHRHNCGKTNHSETVCKSKQTGSPKMTHGLKH